MISCRDAKVMNGRNKLCLIVRYSEYNFCGVDMGRPFFISCEIWGTANKVSEIIKDICGKIDIDNFSINPFSDGIENVCIVVNCHPDENLIRGWGKPRKYINYPKRYADIVRRKLLMKFMDFIRKIKIKHKSFFIEKKHVEDVTDATGKL